jgi:hypothetical protein
MRFQIILRNIKTGKIPLVNIYVNAKDQDEATRKAREIAKSGIIKNCTKWAVDKVKLVGEW